MTSRDRTTEKPRYGKGKVPRSSQFARDDSTTRTAADPLGPAKSLLRKRAKAKHFAGTPRIVPPSPDEIAGLRANIILALENLASFASSKEIDRLRSMLVKLKDTTYALIQDRETAGNNPTSENVGLEHYSIEQLQAEITRRNGKDAQRPKYQKGKGYSSVDFFLRTWRDVLGLNEDFSIPDGAKPTISKQRVRDHDEYLMELIEGYISNRIRRGNDLGLLEGITFLVHEEKSHNKTKRFIRKALTAPAPL